jgi:TPR repeat protein
MADVFISYRKADRAKAEALAKALEVENLDVWWDAGLETGRPFDEKIQSVLEQAKSVIVIWSKESVKSEWVRAESSIGRERGILVPVMIQSVNIPVPFNLIHTADLRGWTGYRAHAGYRDVVKQVKELAGKQHVKPLKPPPNPAIRALWRAVSAVAVIAVVGTSTWYFKPWEKIAEMNDPAVKAQKAREASLAKLVTFGVQPEDFEKLQWKVIAKQKFKPETLPQLTALADSGDAVAQALLCAVSYWSEPDTVELQQTARNNCRKSSDAGERIGQMYYSTILGMDQKEGPELVRKSAEQGFGWARLAYASLLADGKHVTWDGLKAKELLTALVAEGNIEAEYVLGFFTFDGRLDGKENRQEGVRLMTQAADKGSYPAMYEAGRYYAEGTWGFPLDVPRGRGYLEKLAAQDVDPDLASRAKDLLERMDRRR